VHGIAPDAAACMKPKVERMIGEKVPFLKKIRAD